MNPAEHLKNYSSAAYNSDMIQMFKNQSEFCFSGADRNVCYIYSCVDRVYCADRWNAYIFNKIRRYYSGQHSRREEPTGSCKSFKETEDHAEKPCA